MSSRLLKKPVESYIRLEYCEKPGLPSQHPEDISKYAVPVWQAIPAYLCYATQRVQKRALYIIYPEAVSHAHALQLGELDGLDNRRDYLCNKYMTQMKSPSHPLHHLLSSPLLNEPKYHLRRNSKKYYLFKDTIACRTKRAENFFTFRYFN